MIPPLAVNNVQVSWPDQGKSSSQQQLKEDFRGDERCCD
jgi:hypothetical protein